MSVANILYELGNKKINDRYIFQYGDAAPDDTANVAWVYLRTGASTSGDQRIYTWDDAASTWDALTA